MPLSMIRSVRAAAVVAGLALALVVPATSAGADSKSALAQVRQATVQFHDVADAEAAGYEKFLPCFDDPVEGGMGQHWADLHSIDDTADPVHPEVLVYEPHNGKYQLVAVEYVLLPNVAYTASNPPSLLGADYHFEPDLGIWALHAYVWRGNPSGVHSDFSPNVRMCP